MTRSRQVQLLALAGSAGLLLGALAFQYLGGMAPCALCILQRWPHLVALLAGAGLVWAGPWALLGALGAGASGAIGVYHTGVERDWWEGPASCTSGGDLSGLSGQELLDQIMSAPRGALRRSAMGDAGPVHGKLERRFVLRVGRALAG